MNMRVPAYLFALALVGLTTPVAAHVTVAPAEVHAGSYAELTFRCPNERAHSGTTKLVVQLPPDHPIASVLLRPVPGWQSVVTMRKLARPLKTGHGDIVAAVDTITWQGGTIKPGEYQNFGILAGPLPTGATTLTFKAIQTYANGEVVRWIELRKAGEPEPAHPAPVVHVN